MKRIFSLFLICALCMPLLAQDRRGSHRNHRVGRSTTTHSHQRRSASKCYPYRYIPNRRGNTVINVSNGNGFSSYVSTSPGYSNWYIGEEPPFFEMNGFSYTPRINGNRIYFYDEQGCRCASASRIGQKIIYRNESGRIIGTSTKEGNRRVYRDEKGRKVSSSSIR